MTPAGSHLVSDPGLRLSPADLRSVSLSMGIDHSDLPVIERNFANGGDDITSGDAPEKGTHGQSGSRQYWGMTGLAAADVARCNTYLAERSLLR